MAHGIMRRLARRLVLIMGTVMALGFAGCIDTNSQCIEDQPGYQEGRDVWLTFDIRNVDETGSRAVSDPVHPDEDASAAENYINCEDYDLTVMYLNEQGRVMKVFNRDEYIVIRDAGDATDRKYKLTLRINQDYFSSVGDNVTFSLLVIANLNGTADGGSYGLNWMATLSELSNLKTSFGYTGVNGTEAWQPDIAAKRFIPMAGVRQFSISRAALTAATDKANELDLSADNNAIDMQRAMAKIRVVDALAANGDTDNKIIAVTLSGMNTRGTYLPDVARNAAWGNPNTVVCEFGNAASGWFNAESVIPTTALRFTDSYGWIQKDGVFDAWRLYVPEFSWIAASSESEPTLHITVQSGGETKTFDYPVSRSLGQSDMARNHIYQFVVTEVSGMKLNLTCRVLDWKGEETVWDYRDNVTMTQDGYIKWLTGSVNNETATVSFNQNLDNLKCNFTIASPEGYTWRAVLLPQTGNLSALSIVGASSGVIDSKTPIELEFATSDTAPKGENNTARLQILVETPWGTTVNAPILEGGPYGDNRYFTISQNASI